MKKGRGFQNGKFNVKIYECIFTGCKKTFHSNLKAFESHFVNFHVKDDIDSILSKLQRENSISDHRQCPFIPCGYYAKFRQIHLKISILHLNIFLFRGALIHHFGMVHGLLEYKLESLTGRLGLQERYMSMIEKDGLFQKDQSEHESSVVNCDICHYHCREKYLATHQILNHYHREYSKEILNFHNRKKVGRKGLIGSCPVYFCKV